MLSSMQTGAHLSLARILGTRKQKTNPALTRSGNTSTYRDPTDAAQVPPSVLQKHVGGPVLEHEDHGHHRERRNSVKSHQETFRGI